MTGFGITRADLEWLKERRDAYKCFSESAAEMLPRLAKALMEKTDRDLVEFLKDSRKEE